MEQLSNETEREIGAALDTGNKLAAVKIYKLATGSSLMTAKAAVEAKMKGESYSPTSIAGGANHDQILDAIFESKKLKAVKLYKQTSGVSLMESKRFIEELTAQLRAESPEEFKRGNVGCVRAALLCLAIVATAVTLGVA